MFIISPQFVPIKRNGTDGTVNGATLTLDRFGNENCAYNFDGVDDFIQIYHSDQLKPTMISICAWVKMEIGGRTNPRIISEGNAWELITIGTDYSRPVCLIVNGAGLSSSVEIDTTGWYFISTTHGNGYSRVYVNSVLVAENSNSNPISYSTNDIHIGQRPINGDDDFKGSIDDIRI